MAPQTSRYRLALAGLAVLVACVAESSHASTWDAKPQSLGSASDQDASNTWAEKTDNAQFGGLYPHRYQQHQHFSLVNVLITVLLVGGELPMIGAFLFSAMLVFTPHLLQRLYKSRDAMFAGLLALFSAVAYHLVCLRWYHAQLHTTQLVIVAPFCQFVLCVAMGMLYAVAMECYHHAHALDPGYSGYEVTSSLRARCY